MASIEKYFIDRWYSADVTAWNGFIRLLLRPLQAVYAAIVRSKLAQHRVVLDRSSNPVVVVVGNITVGGTGKTPLIITLATALVKKGLRVGVVSRGYGGRQNTNNVHFVQPDDSAEFIGDEPAVIVDAMKTGADYGKTFGLAVGVDRAKAIASLSATMTVDVILSDDGLQHYRMPRHLELVVIDGDRGFGNGELLPLGPLREPLTRLAAADLALVNGGVDKTTERVLAEQSLPIVSFTRINRGARAINPAAERMKVAAEKQYGESHAGQELPIEHLVKKIQCLHLVAGIGNPQRYFNDIQTLLNDYNKGCLCIQHPFPDHHRFAASDLHSVIGAANNDWDATAILVTAKDAVKLRELVDLLPVAVFAATLEIQLDDKAVELIASRIPNIPISVD